MSNPKLALNTTLKPWELRMKLWLWLSTPWTVLGFEFGNVVCEEKPSMLCQLGSLGFRVKDLGFRIKGSGFNL